MSAHARAVAMCKSATSARARDTACTDLLQIIAMWLECKPAGDDDFVK
jgi:hypothetical protein